MSAQQISWLLLFLLITQATAIENEVVQNQVRILSVSTILDRDNAQRMGSINGGTRLYIKMVGQDSSMSSNNQVFIGPYPCVIPEMGVNEIFVSCITTPAYDSTKQQNLSVVVQVMNRSISQCGQSDSSLCTFSYSGSYTPILDIIFPRAVVPKVDFQWWGTFRISNTNQITKMLVGNLLCDRFNLGLNEDTSYDGSSYNQLTCEIDYSHPAGFYSSEFISLPGEANKQSHLTTVRSTTLDTPYDVQIVSQQTGSGYSQNITSQGGQLTIYASNIPSNASNVTVTWNNSLCAINEVNTDFGYFSCTLPAGLSSPIIDSTLRYESGSGVHLQAYNTSSWDFSGLIKQYKSNPSQLQLAKEAIIPSTEYYYNYDSRQDGLNRQFIVLQGYFNPPRDGNYYFHTSSSYYAQVLLQLNGDSTNESTMTVINSISQYGTDLRNPYSSSYDLQQSTSDNLTISLKQGQSYYFKIYALASSSNNFYLSTGVRIPVEANQRNQDNIYPNSVGQVSRFKINYNYTKEKVKISFSDLNSAKKGSFGMNFISPFGTQLKSYSNLWVITSEKYNRDTTCSQIVGHFSYYVGDQSTCVQSEILDLNKNKIGTTWELTFLSHRNYDVQPTFNFDSTLSTKPIYTVVVPAGQPLSGTFRMKINGNYVKHKQNPDIPFNIQGSDLCGALQQSLNSTNIHCTHNLNFIDGSEWILDFYGFASPILIEGVLAESKLIGEPGTITLVVDTLRAASSSYLNYPAIETELLTQRSTLPYASIRVNGVLTLASLTNQQFVVNLLDDSQALTYSNFTDDNSSILTISGITALGYTPSVSNFKVYYNGVQCKITTSSSASFSGIINAVYPYKIAGSYKPVVLYSSKGVAVSNGVNPKTTFPIINSISTNTIYSFGGTTLTIIGQYFPTSADNNLSVTIGSVSATIQSSSNTQIVIITPAGLTEGTANIIVSYNGFTSNPLNININNSGAITINAIDKTIVSPVDKTLITVSGSNFGTDETKLTAYLDSVDQGGKLLKYAQYNVNVVKANGNSAQILLGGGLPGYYQLRIVKIGLGSNNPAGATNTIQYNIILNSFSLNKVSAYGGAQLVINGLNFATTAFNDNQVLIIYQEGYSEFCIITAATSSQLTCTLPNMVNYISSGETQKTYTVEVWGKLLAQAIINQTSPFNPQITFDLNLSLQVTSISSQQQIFNQQYAVLGSNFPTGAGAFSVVVIGQENIHVQINSVNSTAVTYTLPNLPQGNYSITLRTSNGDSPYLQIQVIEYTYPLSNPQLYTVSSAGAEITLTMSGNVPNQNPAFKFNGVQATLISYNNSTGQVLIRLPPSSVGSNKQLLSIRSTLVPLDNQGNLPWISHKNSFTAIAATWQVSNIQVSGNSITITGTGINNLRTAYLQQSSNNAQIYSSSISSQSSSSADISFANAPAGVYQLYLLDSSNNYPTIQNNQVVFPLAGLTSRQVTSSYAGGQQFIINGNGFNTQNFNQNAVTICGNQASILNVTTSTLILSTPPAYSAFSRNNYQFPADNINPLSGFTTISDDPNGNSQYLNDGDLLFYYSSSNASSCYCGFNFGSSTQVILSKFQLYPRSQGVTDASAFFGTQFQASVDGTNWVTLLTIGSDFHLGKNMYLIDTLIATNPSKTNDLKAAYQQFRLYDSNGQSKCQLVEIQLFGWKQGTQVESGNTLSCPVQVQVNGSPAFSLTNNVVYDQTKTFIVNSITPNYGSINGGTSISISLDRAPENGSTATVTIDGIICKNPAISSSTITCVSGIKQNTASSSLVVQVNQQNAVNNGIIFYYGYLWSDPNTWGGSFAPIAGDLVYVAQGKSIIIDVPYIGILNTIVVSNANLIFANDKNIHLEAYNILVQNGNVIIGTQSSPVTGNIRITMHGNINDQQFPTVGSKGLSIYNGSIDIQGKPRAVTWTELSQTANIGDNSIQVFLKDSAFDWQIGEEIVIASTDYADGHAERRIITNILINNDRTTATISFFNPLLAQHISVSNEQYASGLFSVNMRAEVGLLTRNIVLEGDDSSVQTQYGAHLMLHGSHTSARIRFAEFRHTGQPAIIGRYPIHFHMVGDVSGSIVEGNAVHDSFARVLTIHATHYLHVKNNVGFNCAGHNIFLEDGIETNNIIEQNLILGTKQVWSMLQSDITAASYWITNPLNYVFNNRAAGGDFYGFWYEIKEHPDGPSARNDICPQGMALGQFTNNIAHSYDRFGLRIFVLTNLQYPCQPYRDDSQPNPFVNNTSFLTTWSNFVSYRNNEDGVLAENVGNMVFNNFTLVGNKQSGFNVYLTNRTDEYVILQNSLIVGQSTGNPALISDLQNTYGAITPRTDGYKIQNVHFANFIQNMTVFKSCSGCSNFMLWVQGGKLTLFKGISYENISTSNFMFWENWRREIYQDLDGTLTGRGSQVWVTPAGPHLVNQTDCSTSQDEKTKWNNAVICSSQIVRIEFSNPVDPYEFQTKSLFVLPCDNTGKAIGGDQISDYYISQTQRILNPAGDLTGGFVGTFLAGQIFQVQWELSQIDFTHFSVGLSPYHSGSTAADTILIKFPIKDYRETWQNFQMITNKNVRPYQNVTADQDPTALTTMKSLNCKHGDWYNDIAGQAMWLCLNANGRPKATTNQYLERVDLNALSCLVNCPLPPFKCKKDGISRRISNLATWQGITFDGNQGIVLNTQGNSTLYIPCPWEVVVDQDITQYTQIIVEGNLRVDPTKNINVQANGIWLRGGMFIAEGATPGTPYTNNLTIILTGDRDQQTQFLVDSQLDVGNKVIFNTGNFTLLGNPPATTSTRLAASINPGDTLINVVSASGWSVGDIIAVAPTQLDAKENEVFSIQSINGNTITLNSTVQFYHFGASSVTLTETWGSYSQELDLRAQVLHLTRNIKIVGAPVSQGIPWGCRVLNHYWEIVSDGSGNPLPDLRQLHLRGIATWNGVEMRNCGQADSSRGGLDFLYDGSDSENQIVSVVSNSSFHDCNGYCANIEQSSNIKLINNNFFRGKPIFIRFYQSTYIALTNNHFVAALEREYSYDSSNMAYDMNTAIYFLSTQDPVADNILINNNQVQGSQGPCLALVHTPCTSVSNISTSVGIWGNQASTCLVGSLFKSSLSGCQWAGKIAVARSVKGIMVNPEQPGIIVEHVLAAESNRSIILRFANQGYRNVGQFQNSSVYAVAITNDPTAYDSSQKAKVCQGGSGTQNLVVTESGENYPLIMSPLSFDVICTSAVFDSSLYQTNVKYVNFKQTYSDANLSNCRDNHMMATHPSASDHTAGTYNSNVTCVNCNVDAYFNFMSADPGWAGWLGGCGLFICTGPENVLNVDFTGSLFNGVPTTGISHNSGIASKSCTAQPNWNNAYSCKGTDYVQLEWQSEAADHNLRSTAPCMITSLDQTYSNKINMFKEWQWDGSEPKNLRENRYYATVLTNTIYNIAYNGLNPYNIIHRIQQRTNDNVGEPNIWVVFTLQYQVPNNIEVSVDGSSAIVPYIPSDNIDLTTKTNTCGANIYNYRTRTVQFVINGAANCLVRVQVLDTVRLNISVQISVKQFFQNNNKFSFISAVASFLGIQDYSRIKVVGTSTNSRFLQNGQASSSSSASSNGFNLILDITDKRSQSSQIDPNIVHQDLVNKAAQLQAGLEKNSVSGLSPNTYSIISSEVYVSTNSEGGIYGQNANPNTPIVKQSSSDSNTTLAIVLGIVIAFIVVIIVVVGYCAYKRYKLKQIMLKVQNAEVDHSIEIEHEPNQKEAVKAAPSNIIALDPSADFLQEKDNIFSAPFQC